MSMFEHLGNRPMLTLTGVLANIYKAPDFEDKETGEVKRGEYKVQVLGQELLKNGEMPMQMQTLTAREDVTWYQQMLGSVIQLPVGVFAARDGSNIRLQYFIPRGTKPVVIGKSGGQESGNSTSPDRSGAKIGAMGMKG